MPITLIFVHVADDSTTESEILPSGRKDDVTTTASPGDMTSDAFFDEHITTVNTRREVVESMDAISVGTKQVSEGNMISDAFFDEHITTVKTRPEVVVDSMDNIYDSVKQDLEDIVFSHCFVDGRGHITLAVCGVFNTGNSTYMLHMSIRLLSHSSFYALSTPT